MGVEGQASTHTRLSKAFLNVLADVGGTLATAYHCSDFAEGRSVDELANGIVPHVLGKIDDLAVYGLGKGHEDFAQAHTNPFRFTAFEGLPHDVTFGLFGLMHQRLAIEDETAAVNLHHVGLSRSVVDHVGYDFWTRECDAVSRTLCRQCESLCRGVAQSVERIFACCGHTAFFACRLKTIPRNLSLCGRCHFRCKFHSRFGEESCHAAADESSGDSQKIEGAEGY